MISAAISGVVGQRVIIRIATLILERCFGIRNERQGQHKLPFGIYTVKYWSAQEESAPHFVGQRCAGRPGPAGRQEIAGCRLHYQWRHGVTAGDVWTVVGFGAMRVNEIERMAAVWFDVETTGEVITVDVVRDVEPETGRVAL